MKCVSITFEHLNLGNKNYSFIHYGDIPSRKRFRCNGQWYIKTSPSIKDINYKVVDNGWYVGPNDHGRYNVFSNDITDDTFVFILNNEGLHHGGY